MSYEAAAIRQAIKDVLHGTGGSVRVVPSNTWLYGVHEGQSDLAQRARTMRQTAGVFTHRFDIKLGKLTPHEATPVSALGSHRMCRLPIEINVFTHTRSVVRDDARDDTLAAINADFDTAIQALGYPGNLSFTAGAAPTGIVSGMLMGLSAGTVPSAEVLAEEWSKNLLRSRISGSVVLQIDQLIA